MLRPHFNLVLVLIAALLSSAAHTALSAERRVGIVLLTPHNIRMTGVGLTVFSNRYAETGQTDKRIQEATFSLLRKELELEPGTSVHRVDVADEWVRQNGPKAYEERNRFFPSKFLGLDASIGDLLKTCQCTDLVLVSDLMLLEHAGTNQSVRGPSIWGGVSGQSQLVIPLSLIRIDAATAEKVDSTHITLVSDRFNFQWPAGEDKVFPLEPEVVDSAIAALLRREEALKKWGVWGVREGWFKLGLRPSCALPAYKATRPTRGSRSDFDSPPSVAPGADPQTCPVSY